MRDLLNTLNNYDWSNEQIEVIKNYITNVDFTARVVIILTCMKDTH